MDPFSTAASAVGVVAVALQAAKKVLEAVERYKGRDKAMAQLSTELGELVAILGAAGDAASLDPAGLSLIRGPIEHCSKICSEFQDALGAFNKRSQMPLKDWARMEFKRGTLKDFTDTLASYKCTLQIGLGTIVMRTTKQTHSVLEGYNELVQDTTYNLDMQLQRIHEKIESLWISPSPDPKITVDLDDEKAVTEQCLRICKQAKTVLERFQEEQPTLQSTGTGPSSVAGPDGSSRFHDQFQAQILTKKAMTESQLPLAETISRLQQRLVILLDAGSLDRDKERLRLQEDIEMSRQCLEVCNLASNISSQKIHTVGEVIAEDDSDQVVVTTLADLFDVKKVMAGKNSAQLVGSMADATLVQLSTDRYNSRFGAVSGIVLPPNSRDAARTEFAAKPSVSGDPYIPGRHKVPPTPEADAEGRPSANEIRRRRLDNSKEYR